MNVSYEGIGQWAATFACSGVSEGQAVKVSGNGTVAACAENGGFDGVVLSVARDGKACSVAMGGMVTVSYSGTAPTAGWNTLAADGKGGVTVVSEGGRWNHYRLSHGLYAVPAGKGTGGSRKTGNSKACKGKNKYGKACPRRPCTAGGKEAAYHL